MANKNRAISIEEALAIVDETMGTVRPVAETVALRNALGRVAFADQRSRLDLPPFDKSAMDGYAVLADDECDEYEVVETVPAGHTGTKELTPGTTVKVMTGAAVPKGTGKVIILEHCEEHSGRVRILKRDDAENICRRGEDVRAGDVVLNSGTILGPVEIANLIACGITEIEVAKKPRAAILSTGDEIVDSPEHITPGKIMNSNGPMLTALAAQYGMEVVLERSVPDDLEATKKALYEAIHKSDITIISGGVSVGDYDCVTSALHKVGLAVRFSQIAVQPGKPTVYATSSNGKAVFGLPGNPVSVFLMFHLLVRRAVDRMTGRKSQRREFVLPLASMFRRRKAERVAFVPASITDQGALEPVEFHGSAHLASLLCADGFFRVPIGVTELAKGSKVVFMPLMRLET
ncbi:MAG: molybdopterin molybdotransferase MoeA [Armatimonadetes bacterium]|nr:molybdopterin molybdotransferase MoeA [Armatimonadota bacterium]